MAEDTGAVFWNNASRSSSSALNCCCGGAFSFSFSGEAATGDEGKESSSEYSSSCSSPSMRRRHRSWAGLPLATTSTANTRRDWTRCTRFSTGTSSSSPVSQQQADRCRQCEQPHPDPQRSGHRSPQRLTPHLSVSVHPVPVSIHPGKFERANFMHSWMLVLAHLGRTVQQQDSS